MRYNLKEDIMILIFMLVMGFVGAMQSEGIHKIFFEKGGVIILIMVFVISMMKDSNSSRRPPGSSNPFMDDDENAPPGAEEFPHDHRRDQAAV